MLYYLIAVITIYTCEVGICKANISHLLNEELYWQKKTDSILIQL